MTRDGRSLNIFAMQLEDGPSMVYSSFTVCMDDSVFSL